ncbi:MAG: thiamine ABC transporter ATP binding subunit [Sodalis sp. Ffu]|nr:MAG: thiamine ABC transporter ATP binding subunit [Sodalis sp. Ffu]
MIKLIKVTWLYRYLLMRFDLQLHPGEKVAVLGPSGAGKSTLLNLIAGFLPLRSGRLWLNGALHNQTSPAQRPVAMLFQDNNLFAHLSVAENIGLGLHPGLRLTSAQQKQVLAVAQQAGLEKLMDRLPAALSGGQRQRTALARCLVRQQPILLLDEPFSALDPALRAEMLRLLNTVCATQKLTLMIVSHNLDDALRLAPRTLLVVDGCIYYDGPTLALVSGEAPESAILGIDIKASAPPSPTYVQQKSTNR